MSLDKNEKDRINKMLTFENELRQRGFKNIAGVDEAGRGPLAGPVVAAVCILPENFEITQIDDSKKLTPLLREEIFQKIINHPDIKYAYSVVEASVIDKINILQATFLAMKQAIKKLINTPDYILFDGNQYPLVTIPSKAIIQGDSLSLSIATASIIAKQIRDKIMVEYHEKYPQFGFDSHKGYGTEKHRAAILEHGPCEIHRKSFDPIRSLFA